MRLERCLRIVLRDSLAHFSIRVVIRILLSTTVGELFPLVAVDICVEHTLHRRFGVKIHDSAHVSLSSPSPVTLNCSCGGSYFFCQPICSVFNDGLAICQCELRTFVFSTFKMLSMPKRVRQVVVSGWMRRSRLGNNSATLCNLYIRDVVPKICGTFSHTAMASRFGAES